MDFFETATSSVANGLSAAFNLALSDDYWMFTAAALAIVAVGLYKWRSAVVTANT